MSPAGAPPPARLASVAAAARRDVDVREDIRAGREPFGRIVETLGGLPADGVLVLRAPFEPVPLYAQLGRRGFSHWTERLAPDDWRIWFYRDPDAAAPAPGPAARPSEPAPAAPPAISIDVRGLEPPGPMLRVLECVEALAPGQTLEVVHDRRPLFLYPQLDARGLAHATDEPEPGVVRIRVWRPA